MGDNRKVYSAGTFQALVGIARPDGTTTTTAKIGSVTVEGRMVNGALAGGNPTSVASGTITVADNDFSTGWVDLFIGAYHLISNVDYAVGASTSATATNLGAAIAALPGFGSSVVGSVVTVTWDSPTDLVDFRVLHRGTHTNFTLAGSTTNQGYLAVGSPTMSSTFP